MEEILYAKSLYELKFALNNYRCYKGSIEKIIRITSDNNTKIFLVCEIDDKETRIPLEIRGFNHSFKIIGDIKDLMNYLKENE